MDRFSTEWSKDFPNIVSMAPLSCRKACRPVKQSESNWDVGSSRLSQVIIGESASGKDNATDFFQRIIKGLQEHNDQSVIEQLIARRTRKTAFFRSSVPPFFARNGSDLPFSRSFVPWENRKNRVLPFSRSPSQPEGRTHYNKRTTVTTAANRMLLCAYNRHVSIVFGGHQGVPYVPCHCCWHEGANCLWMQLLWNIMSNIYIRALEICCYANKNIWGLVGVCYHPCPHYPWIKIGFSVGFIFLPKHFGWGIILWYDLICTPGI